MIGKDQTIKIILSSYIAILASDAAGGFFSKILQATAESINLLVPASIENKFIILTKIGIFILLIVALTTRGAFDIVVADEKSVFMRVMMTGAYGILSAGLIISTILIYVSGASLLSSASIFTQDPIQDIADTSRVVSLMISNYAVWFSLPAIAFVISSLFTSEE